MSELVGRAAVVTGAGRGIGASTALALAEAGVVRVGLVARSTTQLEATAAMVRLAGAEAIVITTDLSNVDEIAAAFDPVLARLGEVSILVNNAATVDPLGPTLAVSPGSLSDALTLNVVAPAAMTTMFAGRMVEAGWGRIVNVSSGVVATPQGMVGGNSYVTSKAALEAYTVNIAAELAGTGVTANVFRPGIVDTAMQAWIRDQNPRRIGADLHARFIGYHETGRLLTPEASARRLVAHLKRTTSGEIWSVSDEG